MEMRDIDRLRQTEREFEKDFVDAGKDLREAAREFRSRWHELDSARRMLAEARARSADESGMVAITRILNSIGTAENGSLALERIREIVTQMEHRVETAAEYPATSENTGMGETDVGLGKLGERREERDHQIVGQRLTTVIKRLYAINDDDNCCAKVARIVAKCGSDVIGNAIQVLDDAQGIALRIESRIAADEGNTTAVNSTPRPNHSATSSIESASGTHTTGDLREIARQCEKSFADAGKDLSTSADEFRARWHELLWATADLEKALGDETSRSGLSAVREVLNSTSTREEEPAALERIREIVSRTK